MYAFALDISTTKTGVAFYNFDSKEIILSFLTSKLELPYRERIKNQANNLENIIRQLWIDSYTIEEYAYGMTRLMKSAGVFQIGEVTGVLVNRIESAISQWPALLSNVSSWKKVAGISSAKKPEIRKFFEMTHKDLKVVQDQIDAYYILNYFLLIHYKINAKACKIINFGKIKSLEDSQRFVEFVESGSTNPTI